jgi:hypothetical protein
MVNKAEHKTWTEEDDVSQLVRKLEHSNLDVTSVKVITVPFITKCKKRGRLSYYSCLDRDSEADGLAGDIFKETWKEDDTLGCDTSRPDKPKDSANRIAVLHDVCITIGNKELEYSVDKSKDIVSLPFLGELEFIGLKFFKTDKPFRIGVNRSSDGEGYIALGSASLFYDIGRLHYCRGSATATVSIPSNRCLVSVLPSSDETIVDEGREIEITLLEMQRVHVFPSKRLIDAYEADLNATVMRKGRGGGIYVSSRAFYGVLNRKESEPLFRFTGDWGCSSTLTSGSIAVIEPVFFILLACLMTANGVLILLKGRNFKCRKE